jgi:hypothetical protein
MHLSLPCTLLKHKDKNTNHQTPTSEQKHKQFKKWHVNKQHLVDNCLVMPYNGMIVF